MFDPIENSPVHLTRTVQPNNKSRLKVERDLRQQKESEQQQMQKWEFGGGDEAPWIKQRQRQMIKSMQSRPWEIGSTDITSENLSL